MTASTTLKLSVELKARIAPLAKAAGVTPHAWMVAALEAQARLSELRRSFVADAREAEAEVAETGRVYAAEGVHSYLRARVTGAKARRPRAARW